MTKQNPHQNPNNRHFHCETCGRIESALLDGYVVGDTLLEQVYFICTLGRGGKITVAVQPECAGYFRGLNQKKWLKEVRDFANKATVDHFDCPKCQQSGGFVSIVEDDEDEDEDRGDSGNAAPPAPKPAPKKVMASRPKKTL